MSRDGGVEELDLAFNMMPGVTPANQSIRRIERLNSSMMGKLLVPTRQDEASARGSSCMLESSFRTI